MSQSPGPESHNPRNFLRNKSAFCYSQLPGSLCYLGGGPAEPIYLQDGGGVSTKTKLVIRGLQHSAPPPRPNFHGGRGVWRLSSIPKGQRFSQSFLHSETSILAGKHIEALGRRHGSPARPLSPHLALASHLLGPPWAAFCNTLVNTSKVFAWVLRAILANKWMQGGVKGVL